MSGEPLGSTLVDREALERDTKRLATRLRFAGLRQQATPEDIDHRAGRGLDRALFQCLTGGEWIERHQDLLVTGPTRTGKTWLSRLNRLFDLGARPPRLPRQPIRAVSTRAAAAGNARPGPRRRAVCPHVEKPGPGAVADPGANPWFCQDD